LTDILTMGVWHIGETENELLDGLQLSEAEQIFLGSLNNESRRKQWLACRSLLHCLIPGILQEVIYDEFGKPHLKDLSANISFSHSGEFAAVISSRRRNIGIDIEKIQNRIERVKERFLQDMELEQIGHGCLLEKLAIYWGAKEAVYKIYGRPELEFKKDIFVHYFDYLCAPSGTCLATMTTPDYSKDFTIHYEMISGYMLVYAYD